MIQPAPYLNNEHDITCYRIFHLIGWFGLAQSATCEN